MSDADQNINVVVPGDKEEIFGTVEVTPEEKHDMIDFALVEDDKAHQHIDHNLEEVIDDSVALESYAALLRSAGYDGVSKQTAKAIAIGVARIDRRFGTKSALGISLEDEASETKSIGHDQEKSGVNEEGLAGRAKELWAKFVELLKKALNIAKEKLAKIKAHFANLGPKLESLKGDFANWSPNGKDGGKKVTIPAVDARYIFKDGKLINPADVVAVMQWCNKVIPTYTKTALAKVNTLTGKESADSINAIFNVDNLGAPHTSPATLEINMSGDGLKFEVVGDNTEVTVQVRSRSEINKCMDGCFAINDAADEADHAGETASFLDALEKQYNVIPGGDAAEALKAGLKFLQNLSMEKSTLMSFCLHVNMCLFHLMSAERDA